VSAAPEISVVICTMASRKDYLRRCLASLRDAEGIDRAEVLLVFREGEDAREATERHSEGLPLRVLFSRTKGLSDKRNVGADGAAGRIVSYLDDDALVRPDWLRETVAAFAGGAACIAGAIEPIFEAEPPAELAGSLFRIGGFNRFGDEERRDLHIGANCAFRRDRLRELGRFDVRLGPGGTVLPWGDDSEMFRRAAKRFGVEFAPRVVVRHHIQPERLTADYVLLRAFRTGRTLCMIDRLHEPDFWRRASIVPAMWAKAALGAALRRDGIESRIARKRLTGYLWQAGLLLAGRAGVGR